MHKMTKKLILNFMMIIIFLSSIIFFGFSGVFSYYTFHQRETDLKLRVETIKNQMEGFITGEETHGKGAYIRFLDDIAMADAYILDINGNPYRYGMHEVSTKIPSEEVKRFAYDIFMSATYKYERKKDAYGRLVFYAGMPIQENEDTKAVIVIQDTSQIDENGYILAISILGLCIIIAIIIASLLSIIFSKKFMSPVQKIVNTIQELAKGNYQVKSNVHDHTELEQLSLETDALALKLQKAQDEKEKLEQMQKDYISNISHELRTPVTVIRSSLEAICEGIIQGDKLEEYQRQMLQESISLQRLVNDMLELSRLQNKDFPIEKQEMNLLMCLEDAIRTVRVLALEKNIKINYSKQINEIIMQGDYGRIRQMFIAILDNAIKYSNDNQEVFINVEKYKIIIEDHGCGIQKEYLDHIFTKFYRVKDNQVKGSGLGMAIVKSIIDRHNMNIKIESIYGQGTIVYIEINS